VRFSLAYCVIVAKTIPRAADKTGDISGGDADRSKHDRHRRGEELAMTSFGYEEKVVKRLGRALGRRVQVVTVVCSETVLDRMSLGVGCQSICRPSAGELIDPSWQVDWKGEIVRAFASGERFGKEFVVAGDVGLVMEAAIIGIGISNFLLGAAPQRRPVGDDIRGGSAELQRDNTRRQKYNRRFDRLEVERYDSVVERVRLA
jgi:hypothetical protein